jgi:parallel beta-helix repeat protein
MTANHGKHGSHTRGLALALAGLGALGAGGLAGCGDDGPDIGNLEGCTTILEPQGDAAATTEAVQAALIAAQDGDTVCFAKGTYEIEAQLSLSTSGVKLLGLEESVLDFKKQEVGANGILITGNRVTVEGFTVLDTAGDGIRASMVEDITFRNLTVGWTTVEDETNGGYALYPVQSKRVLIEGCTTFGASDLGIYLGQSSQGIVRNNEAYGNVAGIEAENSDDVDIHDNYIHDNAAGITAFALPELPKKDEKRIRIYDNRVENNNGVNFAPGGSLAALLPEGTGMLIMAADQVEVFGNTVTGNKSFGIAVVSFSVTDRDYDDPMYDPYTESVYVHDNTVTGNGTMPDGRAIVVTTFTGPYPQLVWDGQVDPNKTPTQESRICFKNNGDADFMNFQYGADDPMKITDMSTVDCQHAPLPGVTL